MLSGAVPGHHLHHQDPPEDALLLLQPDRALSADRLHGGAGLHAAPGLRGEALVGRGKYLVNRSLKQESFQKVFDLKHA